MDWVYTCMYWYILVYPCIYQYVPVHTGMYQDILVCTCMSQYIPVCNSTYMYRLSPSQYKPSMYSILTRITQYAPLPLAKRYQLPWANTMYMYLVSSWTFHITNLCTLVEQWHDMPYTMHEVIGLNPVVMHMINFCFSANLPVHTGIYTVCHSTYMSKIFQSWNKRVCTLYSPISTKQGACLYWEFQ